MRSYILKFSGGRRFRCRKGEKKGCKPDLIITLHFNMPPSNFRSNFAKMRRKDGGPCFTFCKKDSSQSLDEDIIDLSEFIDQCRPRPSNTGY